MKPQYINTLNELVDQAKTEIAELFNNKNEIILFEPDLKEEGEWTKDIYDEIPDFPFYSKYGFVDYAAIRVVRREEDDIIITGIFKGDSYPGAVTVTLHEIESYHILALADYLLSENN